MEKSSFNMEIIQLCSFRIFLIRAEYQMKTNTFYIASLFITIGFSESESQCAYDYLSKAYNCSGSQKLAYCDSAIMADSTYIPAYVYKAKSILWPRSKGDPKPLDSAIGAELWKEKSKEVREIIDHAWLIDSQYVWVYEIKFVIEGWDQVDRNLYGKLNGDIKYQKELLYNGVNLKCKPGDQFLFLERARLFSALGIFDSALYWANSVGSGLNTLVLELKKDIYAKTKNKAGVKHIENDIRSLHWQEQSIRIDEIENEINHATENCCKSMYCQILEAECNAGFNRFPDLKSRCKNIFKKYSYLKPFDGPDCRKEYGKCKNIW